MAFMPFITAGDPDTGETYYHHWLHALERLVTEKGVTDAAALSRTYDAWDHAADRVKRKKRTWKTLWLAKR